MSEIKKGDLVMVVHGKRCGCNYSVGQVFRVAEINASHVGRCVHCGAGGFFGHAALDARDRRWVESYRLKRLDPDALRDDTEQQEPLKRDARLTVS